MSSYPGRPNQAPNTYHDELKTNESAVREAVVFDLDNPRSVLRISTDSVREAILNLPPEYIHLSEKEFHVRYRPSAQENRIRASFWKEYDAAQDGMRNMEMSRVYAGHCTKEYFYDTYLRQHQFVGWMIIPPVDYAVIVEEALNHGISRIRELLELPLTDERGKINTRVCEMIIRATAMLDMRMRGAYVQRSEVKQLNFNMEADSKEMGKLMQNASMEEIERRLKYLERKERRQLKATSRSDEEEIVIPEDSKQ